jgi:protein TonB
MGRKKTEKADLENKRGIFFQLGLVIVLAVTLIAFEWTSRTQTVSSMGTRQAKRQTCQGSVYLSY